MLDEMSNKFVNRISNCGTNPIGNRVSSEFVGLFSDEKYPRTMSRCTGVRVGGRAAAASGGSGPAQHRKCNESKICVCRLFSHWLCDSTVPSMGYLDTYSYSEMD